MNENYRSTPNILTLGNTLIKKNKIRVDKDMITQNKSGIDVVHFHGKNDLEESSWVANEIKSILEKGEGGYSDFAILYRAGHVSRSIEQTFVRENIPYSVYGGIRFFERKEIKDVLSYLRLIEKGDDLSFLRIISTPRRGLGKKFVEEVAKVALENDTSLMIALEDNIESETLKRQGSVEFVKMVQKLRTLKESLTVSDLIKEVLDATGLTVMYRSEGDTDRLDNIKELQNSIILMETEQQERIDLSEYLQEIALYTNMDIDSDTDQRVKLMTIHTSKGLEFPHVFLCGFTEGIIPSAMSLKERRIKALEEERRLAYVAITRAEKSFYMTESEGYNFSTESNKYPSRFLFEISEDHFVRKGVLNKELIQEAKNFLIHGNRSDSEFKQHKLGDLVEHKIWGLGEISEVDSDNGEYQIKFRKTGKIKPINFEFRGLMKYENLKEVSRKKTDNTKSKMEKNL
ncbi:MAG: 3'-5' exonuclease [Lutimonas sp.]